MSHLQNLQRDQLHVSLDVAAGTTFGTSGLIGDTINMIGSSTVYQDFISRCWFATDTNVAGNWSGVGVLFQQPVDEAVSYRFKVYVQGVKELYAFIGVGPEAPSGGDHDCTKVNAFPIPDGKFDEVICLQPNSDQNPIAFGIAIGEATSSHIEAAISVQRLSVAPPQYSSAVA